MLSEFDCSGETSSRIPYFTALFGVFDQVISTTRQTDKDKIILGLVEPGLNFLLLILSMVVKHGGFE